MLYCENWDYMKKRFMEFWARENHDRPLLHIEVLKDTCEKMPISAHKTLRERWMDTDYIIKRENWRMQNTLFLGEAFPVLNPDFGPDYFSTGYGTQLEFGENTSWAKHILNNEDVENYKGFSLDMQNEYYLKMQELTRAATEDGKDKYLVGITDLHPGADGLVSLRGPQELCCDTYDNPDFIKRGVMDLFPGFQKVYEQLYKITTKYQKGSTCWMPLWHPGRWYVVGCDFSCMISEDMYERLLVEEIEKEVNYLDASMYHLDGPGALRHLNRILEIPKLNGVQWVYGAGQPTASHWIPVIKKIQEAGKCVMINVMASELEFMLREVSPEGVFYWVEGIHSEDEARNLMKLASSQKAKL